MISKINRRIKMLSEERDFIIKKCNLPSFSERVGRFIILARRKYKNSDKPNVRYYWGSYSLSELWTSTACVNWDK